jgi:beta-galactosidase
VDAFQLQENTSLADLLKYKVLIYPHPAILAPPAARLLEEYVSQGGIAIFGARSGYKDQTGQCYMQPLPGYLAELCGVTVDDFSLVGPDQPAPEFKLAGQAQFSTHGFFEILTPSAATAQVLAGYSDNYYQGKPALVRNSFGQGYSYYFGSAFNEDVASTLVKDYLPLTSPAAEWLSLPAEVELAIRQDSATGEKIFILLNYSETAQDITLKKEKLDLISGRRLAGISSLEAFGIRVLGE